MAASEDFKDLVRRTLHKAYPTEQGWEVEESPLNMASPPAFLVRRGRHVVVVDVRYGGRINLEDVLRIDSIRETVLGIDAVLYAPMQSIVLSDVQRHAERLGVRIIKLPSS